MRNLRFPVKDFRALGTNASVMTACDDFEVALEMKLHGALDAAGVAALEDHLKSCASCRAFENLSKQTETAMAWEAASQAQAINWQAMRERIKTRLKEDYSRALKAGGLFALLTLPAVVLMQQNPGSSLLSIAVVWVTFFPLLVFRNHRRVQQISEVQQNRGEFLFRYRRDLERRLRVAQAGLLVPLLPVSVLGKRYLFSEEVSPTQFWAFIGLILATGAGGFYSFLVRRPQLKRQLEVLKQ